MAVMAKPDAFVLLCDGDEATLIKLAEFKSGSEVGWTKKLEGFGKLIAELTDNPAILPTLLQESIGNYVQTPRVIHIPPLDQITAHFMAQLEHGTLFENKTPLRVTWESVPV